jgi:hypothetical protein
MGKEKKGYSQQSDMKYKNHQRENGLQTHGRAAPGHHPVKNRFINVAPRAGPVKKLYMLSWFFLLIQDKETVLDLPYNVQDLFEFFSLSDIQQFKQDGFDAGYFGSGTFTLFKADLLIFAGA